MWKTERGIGSRFAGWLIVLTALYCLAPFGPPARADADQEQCSCNLQISGINKAGSRTANAAACVRHQFQNWCEIYVAALENTRQQHDLVVAVINAGSGGNAAALTPLLMGLFNDYAKSIVSTQPGASARLQHDGAQLESLMKNQDNAALISKCVLAFRSRETVNYQIGDISCSVGEVSKWLSVTFRIEDDRYTYLLAPAT